MMDFRKQLNGIKDSLLKNLTERQQARLIFMGILTIALLSVVIYSNILHAPFVFDDHNSIVDNDTIKNIKASLKRISDSRSPLRQ